MSCTKTAITKVLTTKLAGQSIERSRKSSFGNAKVLIQPTPVTKISPFLEQHSMPKLRNISIPTRDSRYSYFCPDI